MPFDRNSPHSTADIWEPRFYNCTYDEAFFAAVVSDFCNVFRRRETLNVVINTQIVDGVSGLYRKSV